ncbi:uncharacterized protein LOC113336058 [Papaver somniferum]|uniref:uncharacterized protein LOC113336058 n=1 Tax=Papaver somniferum TaxID=3469 RepID=UPI000E703983|nr:uncharacterized protein LOC113336058 [Papaver somniferum]
MATAEPITINQCLINLISTTIAPTENNTLVKVPDAVEIKNILFSIAGDKAPGPNGFPSNFFQANWDVVGEYIVTMVQNFFTSGYLLKEMNSTFISLISKTESPTTPAHFRPISLCNTTYKIISKILAQRLNPLLLNLISPFQSAFIHGRGLRQGDPLSPYLFLFCMEALSRYLTNAESQGLIHGTKVCSEALAINHLLFADDCMIFCKANMEECNNLIKIFQEFGHSFGQLINFSKSGIFFSKNTAPSIADNISDAIKVQRINTSDKYLRSPLFTNRSKIQDFKPCIEKLKFRLAGWKSTLSIAGKKARCDLIFGNIDHNAAAATTALKITQHLCTYNRVIHNPGHILKNIYYQDNTTDPNLRQSSLNRNTREKFGITISVHIMEVNNNMANSNLSHYTNFAFMSLSFTGQCMRARNFKDPATGLSRAIRGAQSALTWVKEMKRTNINFEA